MPLWILTYYKSFLFEHHDNKIIKYKNKTFQIIDQFGYDDYFIFNYEMYILHRMIYDHEEKIRGNFQKSILSFLFNKNEIENVIDYIKINIDTKK